MTVAQDAFHPPVGSPDTDEERRPAAVRRYRIPDSPSDGAFDKIASLSVPSAAQENR